MKNLKRYKIGSDLARVHEGRLVEILFEGSRYPFKISPKAWEIVKENPHVIELASESAYAKLICEMRGGDPNA